MEATLGLLREIRTAESSTHTAARCTACKPPLRARGTARLEADASAVASHFCFFFLLAGVSIQRPPRIQTDRSASAAVRRTPMTRQRSSAPPQLHVTLKCIISTALQRNHGTPVGRQAALHWH
jgi:hypothetical protein